MKAILLAPVDLLWNGGIGTYVKSSEETNADAGDKANDAIRVNGEDLRARCIGEGGNLGFTQLGRVEYARYGAGGSGGRMNTDFIDNSAGVDTSDHEVNIKILLDRIVRSGAMDEPGRNELLAAMTDEVGSLVLRDNYEQNLALANAEAHAPSLLHVHEEWMRALEKRGVLNRELEGLPTTRQVRRRLDRKQALSAPELSVLLAWTKIVLAEELIDSDLPDDPYLREDLLAYFPQQMQTDLQSEIEDHPLRREIIVTQVVNDLVNGAGMTFWPRLQGETGASPADLTRANFVAREIFGSLPLRQEIAALDNQVPAERQTRMRIEMRTLVERASRWLVTNRRPPLDSRATVDFFRERVQAVMAALPSVMSGRELDDFRARESRLSDNGVPAEPRVPRRGAGPGLRRARHRRDRRPAGHRPGRGGARALRPRRAARPPGPGRADLRAAARRPLADDGPCRGARRPLRRAPAAHRAGPGVHQPRRPGSGAGRGVGGLRRGADRPRGRDARGDLPRGDRRARPPVGGAAGRARPAVLTSRLAAPGI